MTLKPSDTIKVLPNLEEDGFVHSSLEDLSKNVEARGYTGGLHLLLVHPSILYPRLFPWKYLVHIGSSDFQDLSRSHLPLSMSLCTPFRRPAKSSKAIAHSMSNCPQGVFWQATQPISLVSAACQDPQQLCWQLLIASSDSITSATCESL